MSDFTFFFTLLLTSAVFGTTMGAYFCTMQYRIHEDLPLVTSDCICPACGHRLSLFHQIPIISFILLKGKCRFCRAPISPRYPLTEAAFLIYYTLTYCIFHRYPAAFLLLWYCFITMLLFRTKNSRHFRRLLNGFLIVTVYHAVIGVLYAVLYLAVYGSLFPKR